ncbi:MAG: hypothetical protein Q7R87_02795 [Nanoarchaeota archaeon]|nr:hypothetical protein [Nanoarchaeota archaeon]
MKNLKNLAKNALLVASLAGAVLFTNQSTTDLNREKQRAEQLALEVANHKQFHSFPYSIPGAKSVKKYSVDDAITTLVHIRQAHRLDLNFENAPDLTNHVNKLYLDVERTQSDIGDILGALKKDDRINRVYKEGMTPEDLENIRNVPEVLRTIDRTIKSYGESKGSNINYGKEETEKLVRSLPAKKSHLEQKVRNLMGGASSYFIDGTLDIRPAETVESNAAAVRVNDLVQKAIEMKTLTETKGQIREIISATFEPREDTTISLIGRDYAPKNGITNRCVVTIYGGEHKFGDNASDWNRKNPKQKMALIEITPSFYSDK